MALTAILNTPRVERKPRRRLDLVLTPLIVLAVWAQLLFKLRIDWSTNAQYQFGPFVPFFIVFLLFLRFQDRPPAKPFRSSTALFSIAAGLLICLLPLRLIQEANPDWRPLNWVHASIVVALTVAALAYFGGWPWVRHFAPPLILLFFALPWPLAIEQGVIQRMARLVAAITAEVLDWVDIPAFAYGNVIQVPTGPVGVADACSGVRSLAGTLMASAFFGEFYRLGWLKRFLLLAGGVFVAFLLNLVRTFLLGWIAGRQGIEAIAGWHDQTGFLIFCAAFGALWFAGSRLVSPAVQNPSQASALSPLRPVRLSLLLSAAAWLLLTEFGTEAWYRIKEQHLPHVTTWNFVLPDGNPSVRTGKVADEARAILRFSEGHSIFFGELGRPLWQIFYFRWAPGRSSSQLAVLHRPDICLPAAGLKFVSSSPPVYVKLGSVTIPFDCSVFDSGEARLYVFRTLCEDRRPLGSTSGFDQSIVGRLQSAWHGRRNLGQKLLQIGIEGSQSQQTALADLQARLPQFLAVSE